MALLRKAVKAAESPNIDRIAKKAARLKNLRTPLDRTLEAWNKAMAAAVPKELSLAVHMKVKDGKGKVRWLSWKADSGAAVGPFTASEPPKTYEEKRDIIELLPQLEERIEKELSELIDSLEQDGALSIVEDVAQLSAPQTGELSPYGSGYTAPSPVPRYPG